MIDGEQEARGRREVDTYETRSSHSREKTTRQRYCDQISTLLLKSCLLATACSEHLHQATRMLPSRFFRVSDIRIDIAPNPTIAIIVWNFDTFCTLGNPSVVSLINRSDLQHA